MFDITTKQGMVQTIADLRDDSKDKALTEEILETRSARQLMEIANKRRLFVWHEVDGHTNPQAGADEFSRCTTVAQVQRLMLRWVKAHRMASLLTADEFEKAMPTMKFDA